MSDERQNTMLQRMWGSSLIRAIARPAGRGIVARELRAVLPSVFALLLLQAILQFIPMGSVWFSPDPNAKPFSSPPEALDFLGLCMNIFLIMTAFVCGLQCGAEEEESGTIELLARLPLTPVNLLARKLWGALLAFGAGAVGSATLTYLFEGVYDVAHFKTEAMTRVEVWFNCAIVGLFFAWALAGAAWIRRVLPAAAAAGFAAMLFCLFIQDRNHLGLDFEFLDVLYEPQWRLVAVTAAIFPALFAAVIRYQTRAYVWTRNPEKLPRFGRPLSALRGAVARLAEGPGRMRKTLRTPLGFAREIGLPWKERRSRRWLLIILASLLILLPAARLAYGTYKGEPTAWSCRAMYGEAVLFANIVYFVSVLLLGSMLFSREERDTRGLLYLVPLTRSGLLWIKLRRVVLHLTILTVLYASVTHLLFEIYNTPLKSVFQGVLPPWDPRMRALAPIMIFWAIPAVLLAAILRFHFQAIVTNLVMSAIAGGFLLYLFHLQFGPASIDASDIPQDMGPAGHYTVMPDPVLTHAWLWRSGISCATTTLALAAWLFGLFRRGSVQEFGQIKKSMFGLLFVFTFVEASATFFLCGWRDLVFMIFGR